MKNKLKSLAAPRTWNIRRKKNVWTTKPKGPHKLSHSIAVGTILKQYLKYAKTAKEVKNIVCSKGVLINNRKAKDIRSGVGIMDIFEIPELKEKYVLLVNTKGRLCLVKTSIDFKISKITGKKKIKGKTQLNLFGGENILVEKDGFKVGDSVLLDFKEARIKEHLKFSEDSTCILLGGSHVGEIGKIKKIQDHKIIITGEKNNEFETLKRFVYVIGKEKSPINVCEK